MLEEPLAKDPNGPEPLGKIIKFTLAAEPRGNVNTNELQAIDAVNRAAGMVSALGPSPEVVGLAGSAIDTVTNAVTQLQTFENTWGVLLQRMAAFNKIVAGIAEVFSDCRCHAFSV